MKAIIHPYAGGEVEVEEASEGFLLTLRKGDGDKVTLSLFRAELVQVRKILELMS